MDKTPKAKSLRFVKQSSNKKDDTSLPVPKTNNDYTSTPIKGAKKPRRWENESCSQDSGEIDVTWDWDSPKNIKPKILRTKKKEIFTSPKVTLKKSSQIDHIKNFEKLREELQLLRDEIARVDDDCLPLSPVDEQKIKEESIIECNDINSFIEEQYFHIENQESESYIKNDKYVVPEVTIGDMFDDSCDEQLFLCSQALEEKFADPKKVGAVEQYKILQTNNCNMQRLNVGTSNYKSSDHEKVIQNDRKNETKPEIQGISNFDNDNVQFRSIDDSFDSVLKEFEDEDLDILTQSNNNNTVPEKYQSNSLNSSFKRTVSDANVQYVPRKIEIEKPRFIFHRTHSFESAVTSKQDDLPQCLKDEIERKRKEALGRLKEKKEKEKKIQQTQAINDSYSNISPMKCSPDEIEQKRLQAKAIRDAKQRGIMEKNRLEALKRLEINRLKRQGKIK